MSRNRPEPAFNFGRLLRKWFVSGFVVFTFVVYAVHERLASQDTPSEAIGLGQSPVPTSQPQQTESRPAPASATPPAQLGSSSDPAATDTAVPTGVPQILPTLPVLPSPTAQGQYKDGTYNGPEVDAFYGLVRVRAVVQNGQLANVSFLEYPKDRRTSQQINSIAMPYLTSEAIQAQSANVDIISGATLTSEAFAQSLQVALASAQP